MHDVPLRLFLLSICVCIYVYYLQLQVEDIDKDDGDNPQLCSEYAKEIYLYMRTLENQMKVPAGYLDREGQVTGRMRHILVDWLVQVHLRFHLLQETLFLTVQLIDRFLVVS